MGELDLYNLDAEQSLIGAMFLDDSLIKDCTITPNQIYSHKLRILFSALKELDAQGKPVDVISVVEQLGTDGLESIGGISYMTQLAVSVPTSANFHFYEGTVKAYFQKRKTIEVANNLRYKVKTQDIGETVREGIQQLMAIEEIDEQDDWGEIQSSLVEMYAECEQDLGKHTGIPSGYHQLDELTGGFQVSDLIIIGARPSVGKTALALNIALHASQQDVALIFSMEMPKKQLLKRAASALGRISTIKMRNPYRKFQNEDWQQLTIAMGVMARRHLHIFDRGGMDITYIWSKARKARKKYGDGKRIIIMIDYLQLIIGDPRFKSNRYAEISEISRMLKQMARELNIVVIALSQLSRGIENRHDKRPMLSDLRESGQIEQDADLIAFLYREDNQAKGEIVQRNMIELMVAKHRNGPTGTVKLEFLKEYGVFLDTLNGDLSTQA